jgi:hypothetical protein
MMQKAGVTKTVSIPEDLGHSATAELVAAG